MRAEADYPDWTDETELLAQLLEHLSALNVNTVKAWSEKGTRVGDPIIVPRPWDPPKVRRPATSEELRKLFGSRMRYSPN